MPASMYRWKTNNAASCPLRFAQKIYKVLHRSQLRPMPYVDVVIIGHADDNDDIPPAIPAHTLV
jgi:hypothetical protein